MGFKLLFGIHCHQPVDNFHTTVKYAVENSYKPFFHTVSKYDNFKLAVHFSGWILEYIKKYEKDLFKLIQNISDKGNLEFFTGGYYEPILPSIPSDDRKFQIEKLNDFIKENFAQEPKGLWLTERVWENTIVKDLVDVGIEYVVVDDYHFLSLGFKEEDLYGYYITEEEGYSLKIFPINKSLRYLIPFKPVDKVMDYLKDLVISGYDVAVFFDDLEKFGVWPDTYRWVYKGRWLDNFLDMLTNSNKIDVIHYKEFINIKKPKGLVYLPSTSYYEMGKWSLFAKNYIDVESLYQKLSELGFKDYAEKYLKGSIWKNFFLKYPESNRIHKRILEMSKKKELKKDRNYLEWILKAQFNDVLWHGVFGGIYLPNLRNNVYRFIIEAEKRKDTLLGNSKYIQVKDIDFDGYEEIKLSNENLILIFSSGNGGQLIELSLKDKSFNLQNTLTRRREGYHYQLINGKNDIKIEEGLTTITGRKDIPKSVLKKLKFDRYTKNSFIDHITDKSINFNKFYECNFKEYGDFVDKPFEIVYTSIDEIILRRKGIIHTLKTYDAVLTKKFKIEDKKIFFSIEINSECSDNLLYLLEFNFHFPDLNKVLLNNRKIKRIKTLPKQTTFKINDLELGISLIFTFEKQSKLLTYPLETINQSESGVEIITQGQTFGFIFPFKECKLIKGCLSIEGKNV